MTGRSLIYAWLVVALVACSGRGADLTATRTRGQEPQPTEAASYAAASGATPSAAETLAPLLTEAASSTATSAATPSAIGTPVPLSTPTLSGDAWMSMPEIPINVSQHVRQIYLHGQELGNDPRAFSIIGDCDATPTWFLGDFDLGSKYYSLGNYTYLQALIDQFHGSFGRSSVAVRRGFTAASVLTPIWSDPNFCQAIETPLACELRLHRPSFVFILLGTNDHYFREVFEPNLRTILDELIANGVVPILATKADNLEGDYSLNATIARLAYEYDLPLWNFWRIVQPLPNHGLQPDGSHLTWAANFFDDPARMRAAWPWRNLTALQTLYVIWQGVTAGP